MNIKNIIYSAISFLMMSQFVSCGFYSADEVNYEWKLTFEDNFDTYDSTKWINHFEAGNRTTWSSKELQWYLEKNVSVENGILKLTTKKESIYGKDTESEKQFEYTSGMITSALSFTQAYGKWEIKAKFPYKKGYWPAFWLVAIKRPGLPELDVFEYFGIDKNKITSAHHWGLDYPNYPGGLYEGKTEPFYYVERNDLEGDFADKWMVWSFECFPNKMVWKLNGEKVFESTQGIPTAPLYIIANVAMKEWPENNYEIDTSDKPYVMEIDYIRAYKMVPKN